MRRAEDDGEKVEGGEMTGMMMTQGMRLPRHYRDVLFNGIG